MQLSRKESSGQRTASAKAPKWGQAGCVGATTKKLMHWMELSKAERGGTIGSQQQPGACMISVDL